MLLQVSGSGGLTMNTSERFLSLHLPMTYVVALEGMLEDVAEQATSEEYREYLKDLLEYVRIVRQKGNVPLEGPRYSASPVEYYSRMAEWEARYA